MRNFKKVGLATVKGAVGAFPFVGGLVSEYIGLANEIIASKRQEEWMSMVEEQLTKLECDMAQIGDDEFFYSCVQIATVGALKAYESEKRQLFANALYNTHIISDISHEKKLTFLHFIDRYNLLAIKLLKHFSETERTFIDDISRNPNNAFIHVTLNQGIQELENEYEFEKAIVTQLDADGLTETACEKLVIYTKNLNLAKPEVWSQRKRTTQFGEDFLRFIATNN